MQTLVSIVIPMYNVENYINKCVDTIINQTYKNLEIILIDDGSPDNCGDIADNYAELDCRIKVVHKINGGLSDARNVGLQIATGEYVFFVDSDDYVEADMIESVLGKAIDSEADVVLFSFYNEIVDKNENIIKKEAVIFNPKESSSMISIIGYVWNKLYKTAYIKLNTFSFQKGLSLVEDIVFNEEVMIGANKIEYINKPFYHYVSRERLTLVKKYHKNSYDLHKIGFRSRENVMFKLCGTNQKTQEVVASSHINGIRYCCSNMFYYKNNLTLKSKYRYIENMLDDEVTTQQIKIFQTQNKSDMIMKVCIKYRMPLVLCAMYYVRSLIVLNRKKMGD